MGFGAFTRYIDIPQVVLYVFWIFFAGLIWYLRGEDKREGYPLEYPANGSPHPTTANPMADAAGPASYSQRKDHPDMTIDGKPLIVPMRAATGFTVAAEDADPRGMFVLGADGERAGQVSEIWVDRAEPQIRYLEVKLAPMFGERSVLLPIGYLRIDPDRRQVRVAAILAHQFSGVPQTANPDVVTLLEEDRITAYYSGGHLYAEPSRFGPVV